MSTIGDILILVRMAYRRDVFNELPLSLCPVRARRRPSSQSLSTNTDFAKKLFSWYAILVDVTSVLTENATAIKTTGM